MYCQRAYQRERDPAGQGTLYDEIDLNRRAIAQFIPIQVNEVCLLRVQLSFELALDEDQVRVPLVPSLFSEGHKLN